MTTNGHPNAVAGIIAAGVAWAATAILARYGIHLTKNQSHALDLGSVGTVLFVGRRGIKNSVAAVWNGVWNGTPNAASSDANVPASAIEPPPVAAP